MRIFQWEVCMKLFPFILYFNITNYLIEVLVFDLFELIGELIQKKADWKKEQTYKIVCQENR